MPLSIIPQIFYDLIARVLPGMIVMVIWYLAVLGPTKAWIIFKTEHAGSNFFYFWSVFIILVFSYVVSFILNELWHIKFEAIKKNRKKEIKINPIKLSLDQDAKIRKSLQEDTLELNVEDLPETYVMHDNLRLHSESEAYRLLKVRAEIRMCEVLFMGLLITLFLNIIFWVVDFKLLMLDRLILEILVIISSYTFWKAGIRLERYYNGGVCRIWLLTNFPIGPLK